MKTFFLAAALLALVSARADVTNAVDVVSLGRLGTGLSADGWSVHSVSNYSKDYKYALRIHTKDSYADSPVYPQPIVGLATKVLSSSAAHRRLVFTPLRPDGSAADGDLVCAYSPSGKVGTNLVFRLAREDDVRRFRIHLDNGGGTTAWGLVSLEVVTADPPPAPGFALHYR